MFDKITSKENIYKAYRKAMNGKSKYRPEALEFAQNETYNLRQLRQSLIDETYTFDGYIRFPVFEPKERIVDAPHLKDKIVQLAINNILKEIYIPTFTLDSYACIDGRGTHKCVDRLQHFLRKAKWEYGDGAYIVKADIKKFFYSIDRAILKSMLPKKIKCKKTLRLLHKIIDSANIIDPLGMPLGNTLSQICANLYMSRLDHHCKRMLGLKYYIRYMDDIVIILPDKQSARQALNVIRSFAATNLHLTLNENKAKIFPISQGVNTIGFKVYATHRLLRNDCKKKIKRKIKAMPRLITEGKLTVSKAEQMLNSWLGHAGNASSQNFIKSLTAKHPYIYLSPKGLLKINKHKLEVTPMQPIPINCPHCNHAMEYWTRENYIHCPACGEKLTVEPCAEDLEHETLKPEPSHEPDPDPEDGGPDATNL